MLTPRHLDNLLIPKHLVLLQVETRLRLHRRVPHLAHTSQYNARTSISCCCCRFRVELPFGEEDVHVKGLSGISLPSAQHSTKAGSLENLTMDSEIQAVAYAASSDVSMLGVADYNANIKIARIEQEGNSHEPVLELKPENTSM